MENYFFRTGIPINPITVMVNPTQMGTGKRYFRPLEQATTGTGMESETHIDVYSRSLFSPFNIMTHLKGTPGLHEPLYTALAPKALQQMHSQVIVLFECSKIENTRETLFHDFNNFITGRNGLCQA